MMNYYAGPDVGGVGDRAAEVMVAAGGAPRDPGEWNAE